MATLWISEGNKVSVHGGSGPMADLNWLAEQTVSFTTSTESNALNSGTTFVRVVADANCHIATGAEGSTTATTSNARLTADVVEYFQVDEGSGDVIAVVAAA